MTRGGGGGGMMITYELTFTLVTRYITERFMGLASSLTHSVPESIMETCSVVLTFESVEEILWCDHSNETSSTVLQLQVAICF